MINKFPIRVTYYIDWYSKNPYKYRSGLNRLRTNTSQNINSGYMVMMVWYHTYTLVYTRYQLKQYNTITPTTILTWNVASRYKDRKIYRLFYYPNHTHTEEGKKYPGIRKTIRWSGSSIQAALSTFASGEVDCCQMLCNILHIIEDNHEDLPWVCKMIWKEAIIILIGIKS